MHNLTKIRTFRLARWLTYPLSLIFIFPLVLLKKKNAASVFFFFDRFEIGGAQRVHLDILESVHDIPKQVYFTRRSRNDKLKHEFFSSPNTTCSDIHFWCDNLLLRLFSVHYFAFYLNRHAQAIVLGSNSTFFYDLLPITKRSITKIELLHNFTFGKKGMEFFGLANYKYLDKRLVIDANTKNNIEKQYQEFHVPKEFTSKVQLIEFGVQVPATLNKNFDSPIKILYAGRGGPQKRVWLIDEIAEYFINRKSPVQFQFAGPIESELSGTVKECSIIHGSIGSKDRMNQIYTDCHALLLTSAYEGFPMVIKEAMAYGCVPIVTALPGNLTHLNLHNSLLIREIDNEKLLVQEAIALIEKLLHNKLLLESLSTNAFIYATQHFQKEQFLHSYRSLLTSSA